MSGSIISDSEESYRQATDLGKSWMTNAIPEELTATPDGRGYTLKTGLSTFVLHPCTLGRPKAGYDVCEMASRNGEKTPAIRPMSSRELEEYGYVGLHKLG